MTKVSQSEGCALYGAAQILARVHEFVDASEANLWLESYKKADVQIVAEPSPPFHIPVLMEVIYFVNYLRNQKVMVQIEVQRMLREEDQQRDTSQEKTERWTPLFGTLYVYKDDQWLAISDYQFNWVTDRMSLKNQYREYPYS